MAEFSETRSRNIVIKRMIHLGIIADRSEILPARRRKSKKSAAAGSDDDDGSESDGDSSASDSETPATNVKVTIKNVKRKNSGNGNTKAAAPKQIANTIPLDLAEIQRLIGALEGNDKDNLDWIQESLNDAAEDVEDSSDPDDGVPLVPFTAKQRESFENQTFKDLLKALGFQEPVKEMVFITESN